MKNNEFLEVPYMICSHGLLLRNNLSQKDYNDSTKVQYDLYKIENKKP